MMFKIEFENWMMIHEAVTNDFDTALEDLAVCFEDETASGHIIDMETGEVLVQVAEGNVVYIAPDLVVEMLDAIAEEDPGMAMVLALMGMIAMM
jgi:hypothetical protein